MSAFILNGCDKKTTPSESLVVKNFEKPNKPVEVLNPKFKYDGNFNSQIIAEVKNNSSKRIIGKICAKLLDKDGFEVAQIIGNAVNFSPTTLENTTGSGILERKPSMEVTSLQVYFATHSCADSASEALSNVVVIPWQNSQQ